MIFLISWRKMKFPFKICGFLYFGKVVFWTTNFELRTTPLSKKQTLSFPKNTHKDDISGIIEKKMIFILEKMISEFSALLWIPFKVFSYFAFLYKQPSKCNFWGWNLKLSVCGMVGDLLHWIMFSNFHHPALRSCLYWSDWATVVENICPLWDDL